MNTMPLLAALCVLLLTGCVGGMRKPAGHVELQAPRPYGYVIGDEICHRVVAEIDGAAELAAGSVPAPGDLNRWLRLGRVRISGAAESGRVAIDLCYQVFYAANEVKMLTIPGFSLRFSRQGETLTLAVPAWPFTLSPLQETVRRKDGDGRPYLRPDLPPPSLSARPAQKRLIASLGIAVPGAVWLAYAYGLLPVWPRRRIFRGLLRRLVAMSPAGMASALLLMHQALNTLHGRPLFRAGLLAFFHQYPQYRAAEAELIWFFDFSRQIFFSAAPRYGEEEWRTLGQLCRLCREIERGSR